MAIEKDLLSFRSEKNKITSTSDANGYVMSYEDAIEAVRDGLRDFKTKMLEEERHNEKLNKEEVKKDKKYLRNKEAEYRKEISSIVYSKNIIPRGYQTADKRNEFIEEMVDKFALFDILTPAFRDKGVTDIFCNSWDNIYVEKYGKNELYPYKFRSSEEYENFVNNLLKEAKKEMNNGDKTIVDFSLYGDRYNVISSKIATQGIALTIRKHDEVHIKLPQIIENKVMSQEVADLLGTFILGECNLVYAGLTGSGKTTSMRALLDYYVAKANKRLLCCEDTQELDPENHHTVQLVTSKSKDDESTVDLEKLIVASLRMKPKYIAIGEIRGREIKSATEAMSTGHATIFSLHSGEPMDVCNRTITNYLSAEPTLGPMIVERILGTALDYIAIQDDIPGIGRKVTSITEVTYDYDKQCVALKTIVEYNFDTDEFDFVNKISPIKAKKMLRRGIKKSTLNPIVEGWDIAKTA